MHHTIDNLEVSDNKLLEYHIEKKNSKVVVGSVYKGIVENVLDGMQAAFVNVGLEKNGYLYVDDMLADKTDVQIDMKLLFKQQKTLLALRV